MYSSLVLFLVSCAFSAPKEAPEAGWAAIRHRHAVTRAETGWQAQNTGQDWSIFFDGRGFAVTPKHGSWKWGLRLVAYGYEAEMRRVSNSKPSAEVEKFSYQWNSTLREWYVNGPHFEHGYTLSARPGNGVGVRFEFEVQGNLTPELSQDGRTVLFAEQRGGPAVVRYSGLMVTDASGRELAARFHGRERALLLEIDDSGAQYPITVDPVAEQASVTASNPGPDFFGKTVAIDGDIMVVGAPFEAGNGSSESDNSVPSAGAAYVFVRRGDEKHPVWTQEAYLKSPTPRAGEYFGWSVGISGDTIVVAAVGTNLENFSVGPPVAGTAYVFARKQVEREFVWMLQASLSAPNPDYREEFGYSVAIDGDTIAVGAPTPTIATIPPFDLNTPGTVYVFSRSGKKWTSTALRAINNHPNDYFGYSVALDGNTLVGGAPRDGLAGSAHIFQRFGRGWSALAMVGSSNPVEHGSFGYSVAVSGNTVAVGAPFEGSGFGGVYLFTGFGPSWSAQGPLQRTTPGPRAFGVSVSIDGPTLAVGGLTDFGTSAAQVFTRAGSVWSPLAPLSYSPFFRPSVAVDKQTLVVGEAETVHVYSVK